MSWAQHNPHIDHPKPMSTSPTRDSSSLASFYSPSPLASELHVSNTRWPSVPTRAAFFQEQASHHYPTSAPNDAVQLKAFIMLRQSFQGRRSHSPTARPRLRVNLIPTAPSSHRNEPTHTIDSSCNVALDASWARKIVSPIFSCPRSSSGVHARAPLSCLKHASDEAFLVQ